MFYASTRCRGNVFKNPMSFAPRRTLKMLKFMSNIDLLLLPGNTSFNTDGKSYSKAQFLLDAKCAKCDSVPYCKILSTKVFDVALILHRSDSTFKIMKMIIVSILFWLMHKML